MTAFAIAAVFHFWLATWVLTNKFTLWLGAFRFGTFPIANGFVTESITFGFWSLMNLVFILEVFGYKSIILGSVFRKQVANRWPRISDNLEPHRPYQGI